MQYSNFFRKINHTRNYEIKMKRLIKCVKNPIVILHKTCTVLFYFLSKLVDNFTLCSNEKKKKRNAKY